MPTITEEEELGEKPARALSEQAEDTFAGLTVPRRQVPQPAPPIPGGGSVLARKGTFLSAPSRHFFPTTAPACTALSSQQPHLTVPLTLPPAPTGTSAASSS